MRALALLRVLVGPVVLLHLRPFVADAADGRIYRDTFHEPYAAWYPELPRDLYVALLWVGVAAAVAMTVGFATRVATATTAGVVVYNLFLSTTHVHNNRAYLAIVLVGAGGGAVRARAVGRRLAATAPRPAGAGADRPGLAAAAVALRGIGRLRRLGSVEARRPRLVRRHGHVAPGRPRPRRGLAPRPSPVGRSTC